MEAFTVSAGVVTLAGIGDKSALLVPALAARFYRPTPIILGMFAATLLSHALVARAGAWLPSMIGPLSIRWILALSFVGIATFGIMLAGVPVAILGAAAVQTLLVKLLNRIAPAMFLVLSVIILFGIGAV
jgi:putative Ca2+/H+ antiporter (TMEM165/GDT1 family)